MNEEKQYDREELERLWKLDYESLAMAPAQPNGRLREARFVMQAKVALEASKLMKTTFWMAVATFAMAIATVAMTVITFFK